MRKTKLKKQSKNKAVRLIKRYVKNKYIQGLLLVTLSLGFYGYNELYLNSLETAIPYEHHHTEVTCIDGDTFRFGNETIRLLAIDTPELKNSENQIEDFAQEALDLACDLLTKADQITLKQDEKNTIDKYNRTLAWVYVDDVFLQEILLENGYAQIKYVHTSSVDRKRLSQLKQTQKQAQKEKRGLWQDAKQGFDK